MRIALRCTVVGLAVVAATGLAGADPPETDGKALDAAGIGRLMSETGGRARVSLHPATGAARFVRIEPDAARAAPAPGAATAREAAADFLRRHGSIFGVRDAAAELRVVSERVDRQGQRHITYQQLHGGVPVFGGVLMSHLDDRNRVRVVNGTFVPGLALGTTPTRGAAEAGEAALAFVAAGKPEATGLAARRATLYVFREGLLRGVPGPNRLAWEVEVGNGGDVREFVFVDAHTGKWVDQITGIHEGLSRRAYDGRYLNGVPPEYPGSPYWVEGDPLPTTGMCEQLPGFPSCNDEATSMLVASEETYDLFFRAFGQDSFDGAGAVMDSIFDRGYGCPNASWNGVFISFCPGTTTDDVTAHEWGHAYTEYSHNLIYQWQPGALNESYSDIWGEVVDLLNGRGTDSPGGLRAADACSTFTPLPPVVTVNSPPAIAGEKLAGTAAFGPQVFSVTGDVVLVDDGAGPTSDGCETPFVNAADVAGRIALVDRGTCAFTVKVANAQANGAIAAIVANNQPGIVNMGGADPTIAIPALSVLQTDGADMKAQLGLGMTVNATLMGGETGSDDSVRWLMGEDALAFGGAIRDMWNPTCYANPGKVTDTDFYICTTFDNGGVHINSGIPNHAFALLVDGGSYNGQAVVAIGMNKAAHLYYRAQTVYQNPATDFAEHADALEQSCADLLGVEVTDLATGLPSGEVIGAADCAQVSAAIAAVELRTPPSFCGFEPLLDPNPPDRCDIGSDRVDLFGETFEVDPFRPGRWTATHEAVVPEDFTPRDWTWTGALPDGRPGRAMFGPDPIIGTCVPGGDESGVLYLTSPMIRLPAGAVAPRLTFDHWVATEAGWDGGNLEVSVNGGPWQLVDSGAFTFNAYNAALFTAAQGNTNPLAGQPAFTGSDEGAVTGSWGRSHVALAAYATGGDRIRLRFNTGTDGCNGQIGWYVDSVLVYACTPDSRPDVRVNDVRVDEGTGGPHTPATFTVSLSHPYSKPVWVSYFTAPGSATLWSDFIPKGGLLTIPPLETSATVTVSVRADDVAEPNETFFLVLPFAVNGNVADGVGAGVIVNDDF